MSSPDMYLFWPIDGTPLSDYDAGAMYHEAVHIPDPQGLFLWITEHVEMGDCWRVAEKHGLAPFLTYHVYSFIAEEGRFPNGPDDWFTPEQMADAAQKVLAMLGNDHPDATALRNAYVEAELQGAVDLSPEEKGARAAVAEESMIETLGALVTGARTCRSQGIDRVALGVFGSGATLRG